MTHDSHQLIRLHVVLITLLLAITIQTAVVQGIKAPKTFSVRLPGNSYTTDWDDVDEDDEPGDISGDRYRRRRQRSSSWNVGTGREFSIFDSRGGSSSGKNEGDDDEEDEFLERYRRIYSANASSNTRRFNLNSGMFTNPGGHTSRNKPKFLQKAQDWWVSSINPSFKNWPKIVCRVEPTTTLKLRKTFRPLKTIVRIGADFNTQLGVWQFKSSWEDAIIGGKLTLAGKELQLTKSWQLSVGAVEDLVTRLRFRAAINLQTFQAYARVGFRTERLSPINVMEGFTILKRLPLDGSKGNVKLEVKANVALPEPEIEYSTETQRSLIGMGDVEVSIDELNLMLDY